MSIFKKIFTHDNFNARDTDYTRIHLYLAKFAFDLLYIAIVAIIYYFIFKAIDIIYLKLKFYEFPSFSFLKISDELWKPHLVRYLFLIFNFLIYIGFKIVYKLSCPSRNKMFIPIIIHVVYLFIKIIIEILLLILVQIIIDNMHIQIVFSFINLSSYASMAFIYFVIVRVAFFTFISEPLWFARAKRNRKSYGYKNIGFYFAFWCGDPFYVGTANDGTGKRMYNYYTGNGASDGDKVAGMRLGLRFFVFSCENPDSMETFFYFLFGAPYKNRENPTISHYH